MLWLASLLACEIVPPYVDTMDIDDAFAHQRFKVVCKGLEMQEDETRSYAAGKLDEVQDPVAQE